MTFWPPSTAPEAKSERHKKRAQENLRSKHLSASALDGTDHDTFLEILLNNEICREDRSRTDDDQCVLQLLRAVVLQILYVGATDL